MHLDQIEFAALAGDHDAVGRHRHEAALDRIAAIVVGPHADRSRESNLNEVWLRMAVRCADRRMAEAATALGIRVLAPS